MNIDEINKLEQKLIKNEDLIKVMSGATKSILIASDSKFNEAINPVVRLYAKQLITLTSCGTRSSLNENLYKTYPSIKKWLQLFRINTQTIDVISSKDLSFYDLFEKSKHELNLYLNRLEKINSNEVTAICDSFERLRNFYDSLVQNNNSPSNIQQLNTVSCNNLFIKQQEELNDDQFLTTQHQQHSRFKPQRKSESDIIITNANNNIANDENHLIKQTVLNNNNNNNVKYPVSTPTYTKFFHQNGKFSGNNKIKNNTHSSCGISLLTKVTTPPPSRKNSTFSNNVNAVNDIYGLPTNMQRSSSYETYSRNRVDINGDANKNRRLKDNFLLVDRRPSVDCTSEYSNNSKSPSGQISPLNTNAASPSKSALTNFFIPNNVTYGEHSWQSQFKFSKVNCDVCNKKINFVFHCKCKYCKIKCHKDCEKNVPSVCTSNLNQSINNLISSAQSNDTSHNKQHLAPSNLNLNKMNQESSSNASSCNSSTPNSPSILINGHSQHEFSNKKLINSSNAQHFSSNSNSTTPHSKVEFFPPTLELQSESVKSLINDENYHDHEIDEYSTSVDLNQNANNGNANNIQYQAFNIKYEEIQFKNDIGRGRFGKVYKAYWHGNHAVKVLDFDENITEASEQFKYFTEEVLNLCKTRHTNLILFVGACMKLPKLAIVMSLCRGVTLHKYLYMDYYNNKPNSDDIILICIQIAQGMGYLHTKNLLHKDLRSKNIFIEGNKVIVSDFGLYSLNRLCNSKRKRKDLLGITKECIFYMAPELIKCIGMERTSSELPFTQASDVFAFGTICYELFCFEYPYNGFDLDTIIFLVGNGHKYLSPNIQIAKELKNILLKCWSKDPNVRPSFNTMLEQLRALPKRKLHRSPSHPTQLGRSLQALNVNDNQ